MSQQYTRRKRPGPWAMFWWLLAASTALILVVTFPAHAKFAPTPLPFSCETVRAAAKLMTPEEMHKAAKQFNVHVTASQIKEARKCLTK